MNEIVVARASITYEHRYAPKRLLARPRHPSRTNGPEGPLPVLASNTPRFCGVLRSQSAWEPTGPARDVAVERSPAA